jgi:hypothetical protein
MSNVKDLRHALRKRGLSDDGLKAELNEQQDLEDAENEAKRAKTAVSSVMNTLADEFLCPITQELPVDPVMAEDGKFYERWAIEEWLGKQQRSPSTGVEMGTRLTPVTQVRNAIGHLVASGEIDGDKVTAWKKNLEKEKKAEGLPSKAQRIQTAMHVFTQLLNHANEAAQRETWQVPPEKLFQCVLDHIKHEAAVFSGQI